MGLTGSHLHCETVARLQHVKMAQASLMQLLMESVSMLTGCLNALPEVRDVSPFTTEMLVWKYWHGIMMKY